uniref:PDZ domain-containing protein n=1 Tax=Romanomermis culicivorax TaxID=13658 RepID=A0A915JGN1_ROMCU
MTRSYLDDSGIDARDSSVSPGERRTSSDSFSPGSSSSENGSRQLSNVIDRRSKIYSTLPPLEIKVNNSRTGKWKYMQKDQEKSHFTDYDVFLTLADSHDKERGFGFTLKGGREKREFLTLETVLKNSPADKAGLQIGDQLLDLDGEEVVDQCLS